MLGCRRCEAAERLLRTLAGPSGGGGSAPCSSGRRRWRPTQQLQQERHHPRNRHPMLTVRALSSAAPGGEGWPSSAAAGVSGDGGAATSLGALGGTGYVPLPNVPPPAADVSWPSQRVPYPQPPQHPQQQQQQQQAFEMPNLDQMGRAVAPLAENLIDDGGGVDDDGVGNYYPEAPPPDGGIIDDYDDSVDLPLRAKYTNARVLVSAPPLVAPAAVGALPPAAAAWFAGMRIPRDVLVAAGVGAVTVPHPNRGGAPVEAVALPYRDEAGRLVDVRYYVLDGTAATNAAGDGGTAVAVQDTWLAHGGWPLYAIDARAALAAAGDVVVAGSELDVLALAAAGARAAVAVPQQLPSWLAGSPAYGDARARVQPLRDRLEALRQAAEAAAAGDDAPASAASRLAASLGLQSTGGRAANADAAAAAQQPQRKTQRRRNTRRGAAAASAVAQGMGLLLPNADSAVLAVEATPEGEALAAELAALLGAARCRGVSWPSCWDEHAGDDGAEARPTALADDADDDGARVCAVEVLARDGPEALLRYLARAYTWPVEGIERFGDYGTLLAAAFDGTLPQQAAAETGWPSVDSLFRVAPGELTLVTGVPNSGKSEWLDALAVNLAMLHGWRFALCSLEKRPRDHARQLVEKIAGRPMLRAAYATGAPRMTRGELEAAFDFLDRHFVVLHAADDAMPMLDWVLEKARAAVVKYGVRGLILDPYNELDHSRPPGKNEHEYISEFMARLRQFAKSNLCHVFLVAHPKQRANWRGEAPNLMDISGGANFFAKCDNGLVVHRDWGALNELRAGGAGGGAGARGRRAATPADAPAAPADSKQQQQQAPGAAAADAAAAAAAQQPFIGFAVEIQVQKVRNKTTGTRGVAVLDYDPATGRYYEQAGGGPPAAFAAAAAAVEAGAGSDAAAGAGAGVGRARETAADGAGVGRARETAADGAEVGDAAGGPGGVDDALLGARLAQEALLTVKGRVHDLTGARDAPRDAEQAEPDWTADVGSSM